MNATSIGSVASTVRSLPPGARPSEVWRGAAFTLLRLNPKECEALGHVFEDDSASDDTRHHVLDLLAGAGTFEAQVVMRRLLALAVARRSNRTFAAYVQRLGIIERPDGPTLRFLMSVFAESKNEPHEVRAACAYALGASAGNAFLSGDAEAALRASEVIRRELRSAGAPAEKQALVTALGNAGIPSDANVVLRYTDDTDAAVRAAAALALRKIGTKETRARLVAMIADREIKVAQSALLALADHKLGDEELDQLSELVLGGRTALALDMRILGLVVAQRTALTPTPSRPGPVENALRLLLGRVDAAQPMRESGERRALDVAPAAVIRREAAPTALQVARRPSSSMPPAAFPPHQPSPSWTRENPIGWKPPESVAPQPHPSQAPTQPPPPAPLPYSGSYRIVEQGDSVETVRDRMERLGLDPNARTSILPPPPPPKKENLASTVMANPTTYQQVVRRAR